jgi:periplasmic protein TonB
MNQRDANPESPAPISTEASSARVEGLTHWLIHRAARSAPASLAERLEEEWLADLATRPSPLSRLRFALGCCWATRVIAHEHCASGVPVASPAVGEKLMIGYLQHDSGLFARRSTTLVLVVGLHIALFYGLMTGLTFNITKLMSSPLQNLSLPEPHPRELPPPPPRPPLATEKIEVPIPEFSLPREPTENVDVVTQPPSTLPQLPPATPPHVVNRVLGGPGSGFPNTDDFYPSAAKRMEEQGVATVRVCVDANGRLTSDPTTVQSSGSARLDAGALQLAKAGSGHYRASTEDGRPVNSCYPFRVRFQLRN